MDKELYDSRYFQKNQEKKQASKVKERLPRWALSGAQIGKTFLKNSGTFLKAKTTFVPTGPRAIEGEQNSRRQFKYNPSLLPNSFLATYEQEQREKDSLSVGYPAWNLLYYSLLCNLPKNPDDVTILETGTNMGLSTIALAQVLKDSGCQRAKVQTVELSQNLVEVAKKHVEQAGLSQYVEFHCGDALEYTKTFAQSHRRIDFVFLDDWHDTDHVIKEFAHIYPSVKRARGTVYFDNTLGVDLSRALIFIKKTYGGNIVEFKNCSWSPPGNAIWQP